MELFEEEVDLGALFGEILEDGSFLIEFAIELIGLF
jgi:hypothetical protein